MLCRSSETTGIYKVINSYIDREFHSSVTKVIHCQKVTRCFFFAVVCFDPFSFLLSDVLIGIVFSWFLVRYIGRVMEMQEAVALLQTFQRGAAIQ
jgi:uncharacterized membrane protein